MTPFTPDKVSLAVITGAHPFDVPAFHTLFRSLAGVETYIQSLDDFVADWGQVREAYDVVLFYNMHMDTPAPPEAVGAALERLGQTPQGVFILHHALLAWPQWPVWSALVGIPDRGFGYHIGETIQVQVADAGHPITRGLTGWEMVDETYTMADAGPDSQVLLTVDHPRSMKTLGWTHQVGQAPVFCLELGHDPTAFRHPMFREVLHRGILWCAGR
jgi:trehalose utilization protein